MDYYNSDKKEDTVLYRCDQCRTFLSTKSHLLNHLHKCESNQDDDTTMQTIDGWSVVTFPSLSVCLDKLDDFRVIVPDGDETGFAVVKLENDEMKFEEADGHLEILDSYNYRPNALTKPIVAMKRFNDPSLTCKGCNHTFTSQCLYDRHISKMNKCNPTIQPHPCPHSGCRRIFFQASKLSIHLLSHQEPSAPRHRENRDTESSRRWKGPTKLRKPRNRSFSDNIKEGRENKLEKQNRNNRTAPNEEDEVVSLPKCEKTEHSHSCSICGETFRLPASLRVHMTKDHINLDEVQTSRIEQEQIQLLSSNPILLLTFGGNAPNNFGRNYQNKVVGNESGSFVDSTNDDDGELITEDAIKLEIKEEIDIDLGPVKFEVITSDSEENVYLWY
ncbi:uncharacterized protein LOC110856279 [Folsomia candida]|uniref:uncharacterized protein LOC110856279 n=1 Tax=Folsomia candida TaxID=158441 RepID=UPI000B905296|nr:uncharacterized protein LOC110856279 [Folsomia candida]